MDTALILPCFNRPEYLADCLQSLKQAELPKDNFYVVLVDDCSTNEKTKKLISDFGLDCWVGKTSTEKNSGVKGAIMQGVKYVDSDAIDRYIILDADCIVAKDFYTALDKLNDSHPDNIGTGFNCRTKNKDGSERHLIIGETEDCYFKKSVGGCNMIFTREIYYKYLLPCLKEPVHNWDYRVCCAMMEDNKPVACVRKSVVQHLGVVSAMGHTHAEAPDYADDFKPLCLPNVTLIAVEGRSLDLIKIPLEASTKFIEYGAVKLLTPFDSSELPCVKISPMDGKEAYSRFIMKGLADYVQTDFALIIQSDGFIVNYKSWSDDFLKYDYVGAAWNWYGDTMDVGNGGFSLRSKKLIHICASDEVITELHPEDHAIGRTYRRYLEKHHGIKFAPKEVADRFSLEAFRVDSPGNKYNGSFGFHGKSVDFRGADLVYNPANLPKHVSNGGGGARQRLRRQRTTGTPRR